MEDYESAWAQRSEVREGVDKLLLAIAGELAYTGKRWDLSIFGPGAFLTRTWGTSEDAQAAQAQMLAEAGVEE